MKHFDTIFKNGEIVNHAGREQSDLGVIDSKIAHIGDLSQASAKEKVDCKNLTILPGVIDTQVHFREPGLEHKEDLQTGSLAAVMGGVTGVFEMPNTNPQTVTKQAFEDKIKRATHRMHCDFAFWVGGTHENVNELPLLEKLPGAAGVKVFMGSSTGDLLVDDDEGVRKILSAIKKRAAFHSEDEARLIERKDLRVVGDPSSHPIWRDVEAALKCTKRLVSIAREVGAKIHVLHISTAEEIEYLAHHKDVASVEVTPHHLTLCDDEYARLGTYIQMNPPVRSKEHREGIWEGVRQSIADILGSDHAPHLREEKDKPYPQSPSGMTGVQTLVPIMLNHVYEGRLSLERFVDMTSHGPQRLFNIQNKGRIAVGYDADLTIVDLNKKRIMTNKWIASKSNWTPYHEKEVTGWPIGTIIRGRKVMWEDQLIEKEGGEAIHFLPQ